MRQIHVVTGVVVAGVCALAPSLSASAALPGAAAVTPLNRVAYATGAYGTFVSGALAGSGVGVGTTSATGINCTTAAGLTNSNSLPSANLGVVKAGAIKSTSQSLATTTSRTATSTNTVAGLDLLGGLITATSVSSTSTSSVTATGEASGTNSTTLTDLTVGGQAISATTAPNTTLSLKVSGQTVGRVVVNEQQKVTNAAGTVTTVTRPLDVTLTAPLLGLGAGGRIVVGHTSAGLNGVPAGFAGGDAYSAKTTLANGTVSNGMQAAAYVPCAGGSSSTTLASSSIPSVATLGTATSTTQSTASPTLTSSATNVISTVSVLNGLITATNVKAATTTTRASLSTAPVTADNSSFGALKVAGLAVINSSVAPNTTVNLLGLGEVTFRKVTRTATGIKVTMIYVVLKQALGALPTGSIIEIGTSETSAK